MEESFPTRGSRVVCGSNRMNIMVVHWVFILELSRVGRKPIGSFGEKPRASRLVLESRICGQVQFC